MVATYHFDIALESLSGRLMAPIYNWGVMDMILNNVDRILVSSKAFCEGSQLLLKHQDKITIAPMGIDTKQFIPSFDCPHEIVFVGRIIPEKGIHYLIKALKYLDERTNLVIIGKTVDSHYYDSLVSLSQKLGLKDRVFFTGAISKDALHDYYRSAQVIVLPSITRLESFGLILLEGMATGKPIIATNIIPGAVELINKSKCGIIVPIRDPLALAEAIQTLRKSPDDLGSKARSYVQLFHDWRTVAKSIDTIYSDTLSNKKAGLLP
jgi:glycosyltransferase involved in cell wall biosynthesis